MTNYTVSSPLRRLGAATKVRLAETEDTIGNDQNDALAGGIDTTTDGRLGHR